MDRSTHYIIILSFLLFSCGQVGTITGGKVDNEAPKPIVSEVEPPMASTNTFPGVIRIPFDEFIALNKPAQNITVSPKDVTLEYRVKGNALILETKEGAWKENTTYSISLNRAVKDITEGNDSILFYVFSTGSYIDSLKCSFFVSNAYDGSILDDITVGLFQKRLINDTSNMNPRYFRSTNKKGRADFNYLKEGSYYVYAFNDENKNNRLDPNESRGKIKNTIFPQIVDTILDTIYLMPPAIDQARVISNEVKSPGLWCIGFNKSIPKTDSIKYLGNSLLSYSWSERRDSLTFFLKNDLSGSESFILQGGSSDTISKRFFFKEKPELSYNSNLKNNKLLFGDTLILACNDAIAKIDTSKIHCFATIDSSRSRIYPRFELKDQDKLKIYGFDRKRSYNISIDFSPGSLEGQNTSNSDSLSLQFLLGLKKELGVLNVALDTVLPTGILILRNNKGQEVKRKVLIDESEVKFENLSPGSYTYSVLLDRNRNGKWDTGNIFKDILPEKVIWFKSSSTVRANWEVESSLEIKSKLE